MFLMKHCKSPFFVSLKEVFHALSYSKASLLDSSKTSNDKLNSFKQRWHKYPKKLILIEIDVTLISESKLDNIFPNGQF